MRIMFKISLLFVTLICVTVSVPSCIMPCTHSPTLIQQFSSSNDSYTINIALNGYEGKFDIKVSPNSTDYLVYSASISVENWCFNSMYRILEETPVISTIDNNGSSLIVQFPSYMLFHVNLVSSVEYVVSRLSENVGSLRKELNDEHEIINTMVAELSKIQMQYKLKYAISNSAITGDTLLCDFPNPLKYPRGDDNCDILAGNWLYIDLNSAFTINFFQFRLWDIDLREHTYNLEVSLDKVNWISLASRKTGKSVQTIELEEPLSIKYIRLEGANNRSSRKLSLIYLIIDWVG